MDWIQNYQLFLFDFDGILVNTEELHYKAYKKMCADRGYQLDWDLRTYIQYAMYTATGVKEAVYKAFPNLHKEEPNWDILYQEKKRAYFQLLEAEGVSLIPGVDILLQELEKKDIKRCVVTHSPADQIARIRSFHPILRSIPHWITREDYQIPKPSPECYRIALDRYMKPGERVIGFEDSPRGLKALLGTSAEGVLITDLFQKQAITQLSSEIGRSFSHFPTFHDLFNTQA
jgi:HAD superfamily hydrolase (TIGR01509 family)